MLLDTSKNYQQTALDVLVLNQMLNTTKIFCKYIQGYLIDKCEKTEKTKEVIKILSTIQYIFSNSIIDFYKSCDYIDKIEPDENCEPNKNVEAPKFDLIGELG